MEVLIEPKNVQSDAFSRRVRLSPGILQRSQIALGDPVLLVPHTLLTARTAQSDIEISMKTNGCDDNSLVQDENRSSMILCAAAILRPHFWSSTPKDIPSVFCDRSITIPKDIADRFIMALRKKNALPKPSDTDSETLYSLVHMGNANSIPVATRLTVQFCTSQIQVDDMMYENLKSIELKALLEGSYLCVGAVVLLPTNQRTVVVEMNPKSSAICQVGFSTVILQEMNPSSTSTPIGTTMAGRNHTESRGPASSASTASTPKDQQSIHNALESSISPGTSINVSQKNSSTYRPTSASTISRQLRSSHFSTLMCGAEGVHAELRRSILLPLQFPALAQRLKTRPTRGVLLCGNDSNDINELVLSLHNDLKSLTETHFVQIEPREIFSNGTTVGSAESFLRKHYEVASNFVKHFNTENGNQSRRKGPPIALVYLPNLHEWCPHRAGGGDIHQRSSSNQPISSQQLRRVAQLLTLLDGASDMVKTNNEGIIISVASTTDSSMIDAALRRPGRFDHEIQLASPDLGARIRRLVRELCERKKYVDHTLSKMLGQIVQLLPDCLSWNTTDRSGDNEFKQINNGSHSSSSMHISRETVDRMCREFSRTLQSQHAPGKNITINDSTASNNGEKISIQSLCDFGASLSGFSLCDISRLVKEAILSSISRSAQQTDQKSFLSIDSLNAAMQFLNNSLRHKKSSHNQSVIDPATTPTISWESIGGLSDVKDSLRKAIEWPLKYRSYFDALCLEPPRGILLFGPPGCSKTMLVRAAAYSCKASFFSLSGADILSPYVGESERILRDVFRRAREAEPSIIFIDEIEALVGTRSGSHTDASGGILTTLLTEMDGVESIGQILVIGATNMPEKIDAALLRPGRFETRLLVPPPDFMGRVEILKIYMSQLPVDYASVDIEYLARKTEWYTGAELEAVCREAALSALRSFQISDINLIDEETIEAKKASMDLCHLKISMCHFEAGFRHVRAYCRTDPACVDHDALNLIHGEEIRSVMQASDNNNSNSLFGDAFLPASIRPFVRRNNPMSQELERLKAFASGQTGLGAGITQ